MSELAAQLAAFALAPLPVSSARAHRVLRLSLLDWAAVTLAGYDEPVSKIVRDMAIHEAGQGLAHVLGADTRLPARSAALVNGTMSHALDYDDTHFAHIGHPSVAVLPAALALAEQTGAPDATFLDAALIGVEASIRVGLWLGRAHYQTGFHQTATAGAFGATLTAARLLRLSEDQTAQALGVATSRAAGLKSQFGTMAKPYHAGLAAQTGVEAAMLAQAGFVANPAALDGPQGFGPTHAGQADLSGLDKIGEVWLFESVSHKFHACCHGTHAALEALGSLRDRCKAPQIARIRIVTHPRWLSVCDIAAPQTGLEAKFSYRLTAAMVLSGVDTGALDSFSDDTANRADLRSLAQRVEVVADDTLPETAAKVTVTLKDGILHDAHHDLTAAMPMAERQAKVCAKAAALLGAEKAGALWHAIEAGSFTASDIWTGRGAGRAGL